MKERTRVIVTFAVLVVLIAGLYLFADWFSKTTGYILGEEEKVKLVECLNEKNAVMYGSATCPKCDAWKEKFGSAFSRINYVVCSSLEGKCGQLNALPAWEISGKLSYGVDDFKELIEVSGCGLG